MFNTTKEDRVKEVIIKTIQGTEFTVEIHTTDKDALDYDLFTMGDSTTSFATANQAVGQIKRWAKKYGWPDPLYKWHVLPATTYGNGRWYYGLEK
jgi:hypothetical protein